jgi:RNA 2',3'-cyclic 3'-phosphodiesterase
VAGDERIRLFCALQLPEEALDRVVAWQQERLGPIGERLRPVPRRNLHATLAFLGTRPAGDVSVVAAALREAALAAEPVELQPRRYRETRNVGMIVCDDTSGAGAALAADLGDRLERAGVYRREPREWLAHVTVARFREQPGLRFDTMPDGNICSVRCALYRSSLGPAGAAYDVLASVALGGR